MLALVGKQAEYAVVALVDLASAGAGQAVRAPDIARRHGIPGPALEQVMVRLRRQGLLRSARGPSGGYILARAGRDVTLLDVLEVFLPGRSVSGEGSSTGCRESVGGWIAGFESAVSGLLKSTTLADLAERGQAVDMAQAIMPGL